MSDSREYEVVVVGGGPAGLSAARTAARLGFRTLVLERLSGRGESAHPCSGVVAPIPGLVSIQHRDEGLYYPEIDLLVPRDLVIGFAPLKRYTSPGGYEFEAVPAAQDGLGVAVVTRAELLELMAQQAESAGAELSYGMGATGLVWQGDRVAGVRTAAGEIGADIVIAAEGVARGLVEEAGLYGKTPVARRYAFVVSQEMEAPHVTAGDLGQIVTFGKRFTSAAEGFGTVVLPAPGRASVYFTVFADRLAGQTVQSTWTHLDEYVGRDPRVCELLAGGRILTRSGYRMVVRDAPERVVHDGLIGVGDSITPGGHLGLLPAAYFGRQAALIAAGAIDEGDCSASHLAPYARLFHGPMLRSLAAEGKLIMELTGMTDDEIDRLCQTLQTLRVATPYFSNWRTIAWDTIAWMLKQFPLIARDWDLLQRTLANMSEDTAADGSLPLDVEPATLAHPNALTVPLRVRVMG